ncbi:MAG: YeiH family protein [Actinomycetes bacterium]
MTPQSRPSVRGTVPGLAVVASGAVAAVLLHQVAGALNVLTAAVLVGVVVRARGPLPAWARSGVTFARRWLLQAGVVLLGLELSMGDVRGLGAPTLALVVGTVLVTFVVTRWFGRLAGLPEPMALFIATGFSICGVSAVAAMSSTRRHDEEDVATAAALVTLCGSLAILVLPMLREPFGLSHKEFGLWVGASVHDVGQVVATAGGVGATALATAVVVKLVRVVMLAPIVAGVSAGTGRDQRPEDARDSRRPFVPLFVLLFLAAVAVRSASVLPGEVLDLAVTAKTVLLAAALFALGAGVDLRSLVSTSRRAAAVGMASWLLVAGVSLAGLHLVHLVR